MKDLSEFKKRSIRYHVRAMLGTHDFERACLLASLVFDVPAKEIEKLCPEEKELAKPVKTPND